MSGVSTPEEEHKLDAKIYAKIMDQIVQRLHFVWDLPDCSKVLLDKSWTLQVHGEMQEATGEGVFWKMACDWTAQHSTVKYSEHF